MRIPGIDSEESIPPDWESIPGLLKKVYKYGFCSGSILKDVKVNMRAGIIYCYGCGFRRPRLLTPPSPQFSELFMAAKKRQSS